MPPRAPRVADVNVCTHDFHLRLLSNAAVLHGLIKTPQAYCRTLTRVTVENRPLHSKSVWPRSYLASAASVFRNMVSKDPSLPFFAPEPRPRSAAGGRE